MQVDAMSTRDYYVKLDNFFVENIEMQGFIRISASSGPDLLSRVIHYYGFDHKNALELRLWSSPHRLSSALVRLDQLEIIPEDCEFVWIRGAKSYVQSSSS